MIQGRVTTEVHGGEQFTVDRLPGVSTEVIWAGSRGSRWTFYRDVDESDFAFIVDEETKCAV